MVLLQVAGDDLSAPKQMTTHSGFKVSPVKAMPTSGIGSIPVKTSRFHAITRILFAQFRVKSGTLINVQLEPPLLLELPDEAHGLVGRPGAELGHDIDQRALHVLGHALGIAADIDMGAFGER